MGKAFRSFEPDQMLLMPPSLDDWLPADHLARFIRSVVNELDLGPIYASYEIDPRGQAAYEPAMMVGLLLYGYCIGKWSSRKIERATYDEVPFRYLSVDQHPDHDTIAAFRQRHAPALQHLFVEVLRLCKAAGLVKLGNVAIDGTKLKANANAHRRRTYSQLAEEERRLCAQVDNLLGQAAHADEQDDKRYGKGRRGDELPADLADPEKRLATIRAAMAALKAEATAQAEADKATYDAETQRRRETPVKHGRDQRRPPSNPGSAVPDDDRPCNLTDPDSRTMRDGATGGFVQGYNAQLAVDAEHQVIVAAHVCQAVTDHAQLIPMLDQLHANVGAAPMAVTADAGYFSLDNITAADKRGLDVYIPPPAQPQRRGKRAPCLSAPVQRMRDKLTGCVGVCLARQRKCIIEPVFGIIKEQRGFRRFARRGLANVRAEWNLISAAYNVLKLFRMRPAWHPA